ncbi:MAG TPA: FAD-dependent oxidoreductase, partial [Methanomassiliicoccales archaeon]|nr:FAD-dependent oxidoreductase [Methanomassiliicoccales archaeon]
MSEGAKSVGSRQVAVIGAGVAGLSAAVSLAERGFRPVLIEAKGELGGEASEFACKGLDRCVRCDVCLARDLVRKAKSLGIERIRNARPTELSGRKGAFRLGFRVKDSVSSTIAACAIVLAIGAVPYDPTEDRRLGYGILKDVMSAYDAEVQHARTGRLLVPSTGSAPGSVAFVQCVGSRDVRAEVVLSSLCSKVC